MYTKDLKCTELYASIRDSLYIGRLFADGLAMNNDRLAVSAMEELLRRDETDLILDGIEEAFDQGQMVQDSVLTTLLANSLVQSARNIDPILYRYGKVLQREFISPSACMKRAMRTAPIEEKDDTTKTAAEIATIKESMGPIDDSDGRSLPGNDR